MAEHLHPEVEVVVLFGTAEGTSGSAQNRMVHASLALALATAVGHCTLTEAGDMSRDLADSRNVGCPAMMELVLAIVLEESVLSATVAGQGQQMPASAQLAGSLGKAAEHKVAGFWASVTTDHQRDYPVSRIVFSFLFRSRLHQMLRLDAKCSTSCPTDL